MDHSVAEYLEREEQNPLRSEYYRGELFAMAGTSDAHNEITGNIYAQLKSRSLAKGCKAYIENLKLELIPGEYYVYPDVMLTCDPRDKEDRYIKRYPRLLVEVLSPGTENHDRDNKLPRYLQIPSLEALLLVSQTTTKVELYLRKEEEWLFSVFVSPTDEIRIGDLKLTLAEVYEEVEWPKE